ncbi:MAG: aldehyde dehydrogenase family protein [Woeseia sp.]
MLGTGPDAGQARSEHPGLTCITATASVAAGQDIMRRAAANLKRISLELGGHAPFIVMPDADIEAAAKATMRRSFSNMGQTCITVNRIVTHEQVHDDFVQALSVDTRAIKPGRDPDPGVTYGPVTKEAAINRAQCHIDDAVKKSARIIIGGDRVTKGRLSNGFFIAIASDLRTAMLSICHASIDGTIDGLSPP